MVAADEASLRTVVDAYAATQGPVAVDAERASGYRYTQRAYLVQLRREGAGTALIDPIACPDLTELNAALDGAEWIVHAATQDLGCLAEVGLIPTALFDTELAGRLLGYPRVALGTLCRQLLGIDLEKGHSAADWSTRPLPRSWLAYAALDVELLIQLRATVDAQLRAAGKQDWARQEFEYVRTAPRPAPDSERWRRISGLHRVRSRRELAAVRALWTARDQLAQARDAAPGRVLRDRGLLDVVLAQPDSKDALRRLPAMRDTAPRRHLEIWWDRLQHARALPASELPELHRHTEGPPVGTRWARRYPEAAVRLAALRGVLLSVAERHWVPPENLLSPQLTRALAWDPPTPADRASVRERLAADGARPWQQELVTDPVADALATAVVTRE